jgi:hypothetical protein
MGGAEHVVVGEEMVEAQVLDRSADPPDSGQIASKLDLRIDGSALRGLAPATECAGASDAGARPVKDQPSGP